MLQRNFLDGIAHDHVLLDGFHFRQAPVVSCPAHLRQLAHSLHRQFALPLCPRLNFHVDADAPEPVLFGCPSLILRKAPLKKSSSKLLSASASFSRRFSSCNLLSFLCSALSLRFACRGSGRPSNCHFHVYKSFRSIFSSRANASMLSHLRILSTAFFLNSTLWRRHFAIRPSRLMQSVSFSVSHF